MVITVLLNLLIAQMSDTYANVQNDAQRSFIASRAWIVAKSEHNGLFSAAFLEISEKCRKEKYYIDFDKIRNPYGMMD